MTSVTATHLCRFKLRRQLRVQAFQEVNGDRVWGPEAGTLCHVGTPFNRIRRARAYGFRSFFADWLGNPQRVLPPPLPGQSAERGRT